jgi:hypothetical protein
MTDDPRATAATMDRARERHADERRPDEERRLLFPAEDSSALKSRWSDIQAAFVDEPRESVRRADALVSDVMNRITDVFAKERAALEQQWDRGDQVTTEDLRLSLQRYRAFLDHLLSM